MCTAPVEDGVRDGDLGVVLTLDGEGVRLGGLDTGVTGGFGDPDVLVPVGLGLTDLTETVLLGDGLLRVVDGLRGGFLTERLDIAGLVADIGDVHVDEFQADLAEFRFHVGGDVGEELVAVRVDFLDVHGGDHQTELTEQDIGRDVLDAVHGEAQQALGGVGHVVRLGGDTHGEAAGDVDADVLLGQGVGEVALDGDGGASIFLMEVSSPMCL